MAGRNSKQDLSLDPLGGGGLKHNPFAALRPAGSPPPEAPGGDAQAKDAGSGATSSGAGPADASAEGDLGGRLVVSLERKGHGGKSVVRVEGVGGGEAGRKRVAKALGRALGRGARATGELVIVQGADLDAPIAWLEQQGAPHIVRGTQ